jgi:radical SAM superfamily enzyme YgiQ (UPF0313 family)
VSRRASGVDVRRAVFIQANWGLPGRSSRPLLGPAYIAAVFKRSGVATTHLDYDGARVPNARRHDPAVFADWVLACAARSAQAPGIIAISCMQDALATVLLGCSRIKESWPDTIILLGGPGPSMDPRYILANFPGADVIIYGEGERTLAAWLVEYLDRKAPGVFPSNVPGLACRVGGEVRVNVPQGRITDLDELPFPDYGIYPGPRTYSVSTARGCPYQCTFCDSDHIWGRRVVYRSIDSVVAEIDHLRKVGEPVFITVSDDTFTLKPDRVVAFARAMRDRKLPWSCFGRLNLIDAALLKEMRQGGCVGVLFGVEAGSDRLLKDIRKQISLDTVFAGLDLLGREVPGAASVSFIWGYPDETMAEFFDTLHLVQYAWHLGVPPVMGPLNLLPGSPLYRRHGDRLRRIPPGLFPLPGFSPLPPLDVPALAQAVQQHPSLFTQYYYATPDLEEKVNIARRLLAIARGRALDPPRLRTSAETGKSRRASASRLSRRPGIQAEAAAAASIIVTVATGASVPLKSLLRPFSPAVLRQMLQAVGDGLLERREFAKLKALVRHYSRRRAYATLAFKGAFAYLLGCTALAAGERATARRELLRAKMLVATQLKTIASPAGEAIPPFPRLDDVNRALLAATPRG